MNHPKAEEIAAGVAHILDSPSDHASLEMIVCRPKLGEREVLEEGVLDVGIGLVGDNWRTRGSSKTPDGTAHPQMQLTLMNSRVISLLAGSKSRWPLAGDQLFLDLDLSSENLPAGTRLQLGAALIEVTEVPHTGCKKFVDRFGIESMRLVGSELGRTHNLRGINAMVIEPGVVRLGDVVQKAPDAR